MTALRAFTLCPLLVSTNFLDRGFLDAECAEDDDPPTLPPSLRAWRTSTLRSTEIRALTEYQIAQVDLAYATGTLLGAAKIQWQLIVPFGQGDTK